MSTAPARRRRAHGSGPDRPSPGRAAGAQGGPVTLHAEPGLAPGQDRLLWRLTLVLAALLAAALLAVVLGPHRVGDYMTETDFYGQYTEGARLVQRGQLDPSRFAVVGPVYEIALALAGLVVRDLFLAAGLLSAAATVIALLLWAALLRRRADARAGFCAALFLAANATFFRYGYSVTTDALALALQAAALHVLLARPGVRAAAGAGALAALAFLTRYNSGVLLPAGLLAVLAGGTLHERRTRAALLFTAGFLLPVVTWVLYSYARGTGISFQLHHNIAYEVFARARGITWDEYQATMQSGFRNLADVIGRDPGAVARRMLANVLEHLREDASGLLGWPLAAGAVGGLWLGRAAGGTRRLWPLALTWALLFLALVPAFYSKRYALALLPFYATAIALFFASPRFALALRRVPGVWLKHALVPVLLAFALVASVREQVFMLGQSPVEVRDAARVLRARAHPGDRIMARKSHLAFYAGLTSVPFPLVRSLPELAASVRTAGVRWLYYSWPEGLTRPAFAYLLDTTAAVPGLTPRWASAPPHPAVLYEIGPEFGRLPAWGANDTAYVQHMTRGQLAIDPSDPMALRQLGSLELARGRLPEARAAFERAAVRLPRDALLQIALGRVAVRLGDFAGGAAAFGRAAQLDPASVDARIGLGWALLLGGGAADAAAAWRPVVTRTRDFDTLRRMIELYRSLGDRDAEAEARATLARVTAGS